MSLVEPRLMVLFLRSRQVAPSLFALAAIAVTTGVAFALVTSAGLTLLLRSVGPLAAAAVVGVAARSPFGETERVASAALTWLRAGHVAGLVIAAAVGLGIGGAFWRPAGTTAAEAATILTRNLAGFAGLALFAAILIGAGLSWLAPLGYAGASLTAYLAGWDTRAWWLWPIQAADDGSALSSGTALLVAGCTVVSLLGARDTVEDAT